MKFSANLLLGLLWVAFWVYWFVMAFSAKRTILSKQDWRSAIWARIVFIALVLTIARTPPLRQFFLHRNAFVNNAADYLAGVLLCALGLGYAVWARVHLGRNWGMPMAVKESPNLVTSGPYRLVRHPIYTGLLTALLGSFLVSGFPWLAVFCVFTVFSIYSATKEEKLMTALFPSEYMDYKRRTKMFIPKSAMTVCLNVTSQNRSLP